MVRAGVFRTAVPQASPVRRRPLFPAGYAQGRLLVAEKGTRSLTIVDPAAGTVIASIPEAGVTGHEVTASPDGRLAYVPIYGNSGVGQPGTDGRNMVVDRYRHRRRWWATSISATEYARICPVFGPKDGLLYVTTELDHSIDDHRSRRR